MSDDYLISSKGILALDAVGLEAEDRVLELALAATTQTKKGVKYVTEAEIAEAINRSSDATIARLKSALVSAKQELLLLGKDLEEIESCERTCPSASLSKEVIKQIDEALK